MKVAPIRTRLFQENEGLAQFIFKHIRKIPEGSIIAIASKIVALSEGRTAAVDQKERVIRKESSWIQKVLPKWWLTVRDGVVIVNAGIDESNADGKLILLPRDSFAAALRLRRALRVHYRVKNIGVVITDSRISPLRAGVTGVALGYAGFKGVRDYRGRPDIFGKKMQVTETNVADCIATAAVLEMGEGNEQQPLAIVSDAPVEFSDRLDRTEVQIRLKDDMFRRLFT